MEILLVEDNEIISRALEYAFHNNLKEYQFLALKSSGETRRYLLEKKPELIVLDIGLPDGDGLDLYKRTVRPQGIPTIFLTAQDDEETIVSALNLGAEDYVTKPFSTKELMARVKRALLRYQKSSLIQAKNISFDMDKMTVTRDGTPVDLTSLELKLLHLLFLNINKVVTRTIILDKIWEWTGNDVDDHTVTVYMKRIRGKVGDEIVTTVKGLGYRVDQ